MTISVMTRGAARTLTARAAALALTLALGAIAGGGVAARAESDAGSGTRIARAGSSAGGATGVGAEAAAVPGRVIVLCSPGSPGNTVQAQPTMDRFARFLETATGWPAGKLTAVYYETESGGLERLGARDVVLALVPLPFLLQNESKLAMKPLLQIETDSGAQEQWSLVAKRGALQSAAGLAGWEVTGVPGYAPAFVRGPILGKWGQVPASARITFSAGVVGLLRSAASGERLAVIVDHVQGSSLPTLSFSQQLEIVARSRMMPGSFVCSVGGRLTAAEVSGVVDTLLQMSRRPEARDLLTSMRLKRFVPVDVKGLEAARQAFAAAARSAK